MNTELQLKLLNGSRQGTWINLPVSDCLAPQIKLPYILETEAIEYNFIASELYDEVILLVDQIRYKFEFIKTDSSNNHCYKLSPLRKGPSHYEGMFFNYFGIASLNLILLKGR